MSTNPETGRWLTDGATVYILEDCRDPRGRPAQRNRLYAQFYGGPDTSGAECVATAAHVADLLNAQPEEGTVTLPAAEVARLRGVEVAARAVARAWNNEPAGTVLANLKIALSTPPPPDARDEEIARLRAALQLMLDAAEWVNALDPRNDGYGRCPDCNQLSHNGHHDYCRIGRARTTLHGARK